MIAWIGLVDRGGLTPANAWRCSARWAAAVQLGKALQDEVFAVVSRRHSGTSPAALERLAARRALGKAVAETGG
ncbi:hypothetical protein [Mycobacterium simiae]|uniref:hypothetical protein n=1 Tax=Mycobacterium simiae TaxID=1784 RepID=UPI00040A1A2F|nr:hypothetical protein [Mycobacterium simiae]PLV54246.1 hypothetical protein X011_04320 [Mycobacterium tuberculosis variant microti OV254]BBX40228.1 hypothetical protein MSIM_16790 [Mycobacterium simiae]